MHLDKTANKWLRENSGRLENKPQQRKQKSGHTEARKLKLEYLAHPKAQYVMTFQEYRDVKKRDEICRAYGFDLIRN